MEASSTIKKRSSIDHSYWTRFCDIRYGCTFQYFLDNYTPFTNDGTIVPLKMKNVGRPRLISAVDGLGLVLVWNRIRGSTMVLELIFGMSQTAVSEYLYFCIIILILVLQRMDDTKIKQPSIEQIAEYQDAVRQHHPMLCALWMASSYY